MATRRHAAKAFVGANRMSVAFLAFLYGLFNHRHVSATSSKMDFLPLGHVRTDPITNPEACLSPHVHTYYGAAGSLRPDTSYEELRAACGNSGNVDDNKSLYWHPTIYRKENGLYYIQDIYFASAYYVWPSPSTGIKTYAFPNGFQMIARQSSGPKARVKFDCNGPSDCERENPEDCTPIHTCEDNTTCFPPVACSELEIKIVFPACSNGEKTSSDFMSHVAYGEGDWTSQEGAYAAECPTSHPKRIPEIQFYFRILNYPGGAFTFSDMTSSVHSDYFSAWDEDELQTVLDECENDGEAAMSNRWCEDYFKFRDTPKLDPEVEGSGGTDTRIVDMLKKIQPDPPLDLRKTVSPEKIDGVATIPSGACKGTLLDADPNLDWRCTKNCTTDLGSKSGYRGDTCGIEDNKVNVPSSSSGNLSQIPRDEWMFAVLITAILFH